MAVSTGVMLENLRQVSTGTSQPPAPQENQPLVKPIMHL